MPQSNYWNDNCLKTDTFNILFQFIEPNFRSENVIPQVAAFDLQCVGMFRKFIHLRVKRREE